MKIYGVVVLYNPTEENIKHILDYAPIVEHLYVMDNSDVVNEELLALFSAMPNIVIVPMGGNQGIAAALRRGVQYAIDDNADFCLTMDQDSVFPVSAMDDVKKYLTCDDIDDYGIIALNAQFERDDTGLVEVPMIITSGNFINIKNYRMIDGFRSELFIDSVDFDLCHQFHMIDKKIAYIAEIKLGHKLGDPVDKNLVIRKVTLTNHNPLRCYYRFRNNYVLYCEDKKFYKEIRKSDIKHLIKIILFEKNKCAKLKMIRLGRKHAKQRKLGKLEI